MELKVHGAMERQSSEQDRAFLRMKRVNQAKRQDPFVDIGPFGAIELESPWRTKKSFAWANEEDKPKKRLWNF